MRNTSEIKSNAANRLAPLLPAQQKTQEAIRVRPDCRPVYRAEFARGLRDTLEAELADLADAAKERDDRGLWVSKRDLAGVLGCETHYCVRKSTPFKWTVATARGTVLHKAVELSVHYDLSPGRAVAAALERVIATEENLGRFLASASNSDTKDLTATCISLLTRFWKTFPPIPPSWLPTTEVSARVRLCEGAFVLSGKYDLTLGTPKPVVGKDAGVRAGKVIVDLKTGRRNSTDPEDLRFYALIETLLEGVPPLGIGSFYVAEGRIEHEPVTQDALASALRRTIDGIHSLMELASGEREPALQPGPRCRWCLISNDCGPGQQWLTGSEFKDLGVSRHTTPATGR